MHLKLIKKIFTRSSLLLLVLLLVSSSFLFCQECSSEQLNLNFPEPIVRDLLYQQNVQQKFWPSIIKALEDQENNIQVIVKQKVAAIQPAPPPLVLSRLYRETLKDTFTQAIKDNSDISSEAVLSDMFDEFLSLKAQKLWQCQTKKN